MARSELTERELLNRYTSIWIPKAKKKNLPEGTSESNTEKLLELMKSNKKEYEAVIYDLRCRHLQEQIQQDIENCIMELALMRQSNSPSCKWDDIQKKERHLAKLWEEYREASTDD